MSENINHSFQVDSVPEQVWEFFWDVHAMARCIPGCEEVTTVEDNKTYKATVRRNMGPFLIRMPLDVTVLESTPPRLFRVQISGKDKKLRSEVHQTVSVGLTDAAPNKTDVEIDIDITLSGLLATLGRNLVRTQIIQAMDEFVYTVHDVLVKRGQEASS
jgi:carbon monoxide dehydrogenase subunit G